MKKILLLLLLPFIACGTWDVNALNLSSVLQNTESNWKYLDWLGAYYETESGWIYHNKQGWIYPSLDPNNGIWFYWEMIDSWVWTHPQIYPTAWDSFTENWFQWEVRLTTTFDFVR